AIGRETTVSVNYIMQNLQQRKKASWFGGLANVFKSLLGKTEDQGATSLLGVRGKPEDEEEITWMGAFEEEEGAGARFEKAKGLYQQGKYAEAINIFKEIIDNEELSGVREEAAFYLGSSLFKNVQYEQALGYLSESIQDKNAYYYEAALANYSFTQYFLENYPEAIQGFKTYTREFEEGTLRPYALLVTGKSYRAMGEPREARRYFSEITRSYPDSEVYQEAVKEIKDR
ncbi:MAG: tetratricopeptide repeat protein, partial [Spirochaetota bacterium]